MSRPQVRIYTGDGEFIDREMNDEEYAQHLIDVAEAEKRKEAAAKKAEARAALLERLGLTEDEAKLLLG